MKTIASVLEELGIGDEMSKVANESTELSEMDKVAMSLGIIEKPETVSVIETNEQALNKEASVKDLGSVFAEIFPEAVSSVEKIASASAVNEEMEKEAAAIEEAKGAYAHDVFVSLLDERLTKIAADIVGKVEDNEDESGKTPGTSEDTSEAEKVLGLNPEGAVGVFKKASHDPAMAQAAELYEFGIKIAQEMIASMDEMAKVAAEEEEEKKELDEEQKKEASYAGAIINEGVLATLVKEGSVRHEDPFHYLASSLVEKIASAAEVETVEQYNALAEKVALSMKDVVNKVKGQAASIAHHGKQALTGKGRHGMAMTAKERLTSGAKALGKASIPVGAAAAAGYGAKKALSDKE
jgi:hypothetical protein